MYFFFHFFSNLSYHSSYRILLLFFSLTKYIYTSNKCVNIIVFIFFILNIFDVWNRNGKKSVEIENGSKMSDLSVLVSIEKEARIK